MRKAEMTCHGCGDQGHFESECPNKGIDSRNGKPPWCGVCDERTRLIGIDKPDRCPVCHPNRHAQLKQHRKCPACHMTVYEWDNGECGGHAAPSSPDRRPDREHIEQIVGAEMENA